MHPPQDATVDACISMLYEAVLEPAWWSRALGAMASLGGASSATLTDVDFKRGVVWQSTLHNVETEAYEFYMSRYAHCDPRTAHMLRPDTPECAWLSDTDMFDPSWRRANLFYREYFEPLGGRESRQAKVAVEGSRIGSLNVVHRVDDPVPDREQLARLDRLLPHMDRAIRLSRRMTTLAAAVDIGRTILEIQDEPLASMSADGQLWLANAAFETVLRRNDTVTLIGGQVSVLDAKAQRQFALALREAADLAEGVVNQRPTTRPTITLSRPGGAPVVISVAPLMRAASGSSWFERRGALVKVSDPLAMPQPALLQKAFRLTAAEARVVCALMGGGTQAEVARRLGVSAYTVKSQLASIYSKTGTNSKAALLLAARALPR